MKRTLTTAVLVATTLVAATACTGDDADDRTSIDAKAYYEDYEEGSSDASGGVATLGAQEDGAVAKKPDGVVRCDDCGPPPPRILPITSNNTFRDAGTNPTVDPSKQPRSTFGLDVDTGSYRVAQRFLDDGVLPPPESVRPEEWINAYDYGDDAPKKSDLGVTAETAATPESRSQLVRASPSTRDSYATRSARPRP